MMTPEPDKQQGKAIDDYFESEQQREFRKSMKLRAKLPVKEGVLQ